MQRIEITKEEFQRTIAELRELSPEIASVVFYTPRGVPVVEYVFVRPAPDLWIKKMERMYNLPDYRT